ncbi:hypothetical protein [Chroococcidiopsis thermalis]|uniref:Uncharacterized protein n=1 Tax=Chroococcidiopsis thermalis (strain PCC 7203) TaxID=251229 RepID=K9U7T2_CHRTP|nr:hypothetical protein [Chroococcidiopsis thermalis]AFY91162.1 hypothetical protein Chro_5823 [Chroococcidiopsis thermalis PCC 7203]
MSTQLSNSEETHKTQTVADSPAEQETQTTSIEEIACLEIEAKQALERYDYYHLAYSQY